MSLTFKTERLIIRPFLEADVDIAMEMFTDPDVMRYAEGAVSAAAVERELPNWIKRGGVDGCIGIWCITDRQTQEKYGSVALLPLPIEEDDTDFALVVPNVMPEGDVEVGYFLKPSAWGKGIATEACARLIEFALSDTPLQEVAATFEPDNTASRNVLEKVGFVDCGTMRCYGDTGPNYRIRR